MERLLRQPESVWRQIAVAIAAHEMTERMHRHLDESSNELIDSELEVRLDVMRALARDLEDV